MVAVLKLVSILGIISGALAAQVGTDAVISQDDVPEDKARQEVAAQNIVKQVSTRLQSGAANFLSGVEHFVVGVLGAINNVNLQQQLGEAYINAVRETTTPDYDEEEPTTKPTTTRPTTTGPTTLMPSTSTNRVIWVPKNFSKPSRRPTKPQTTPSVLDYSVEDEEVTETTKRKYRVRTKPTTAMPPVAVPESNPTDDATSESTKTKIVVHQFQPISPLFQSGAVGQYAPVYSPENPVFKPVKAPPALVDLGIVPIVFQPIGANIPPAAPSSGVVQGIKTNVEDVTATTMAAPTTTKKPSPLSQFSNNRVKYTIKPRTKRPGTTRPTPPLPLGTVFRATNRPNSLIPIRPVVIPQAPVQQLAPTRPSVPVVPNVVDITTEENTDETTEEPDETETDTDSDNARKLP